MRIRRFLLFKGLFRYKRHLEGFLFNPSGFLELLVGQIRFTIMNHIDTQYHSVY